MEINTTDSIVKTVKNVIGHPFGTGGAAGGGGGGSLYLYLLLLLLIVTSLFHWVSGIKEAYKGLLNGDILEGVKTLLIYYQRRIRFFHHKTAVQTPL